MSVATRPVDVEADPVIVPINDDPEIGFREWLGSRPWVAPAEIADTTAVANAIREIRELGESDE